MQSVVHFRLNRFDESFRLFKFLLPGEELTINEEGFGLEGEVGSAVEGFVDVLGRI